MKILVDGKEAIVKKGTSFEFVSENRYFTGSDSYTLAITFPLEECNSNKDIFGHIYRKDVELDQYIFECQIFSGKFYKQGKLTITEFSESEVKCQFLEGASIQAEDNTFDDLYINELEIGSMPEHYTNEYTDVETLMHGKNYVPFAWVNNTSGNVQNAITWTTDGKLKWYFEDDEATTRRITYFPYLIYIFKLIFDKLGYKYDISAWENSRYSQLILCNAVPVAWDNIKWNVILPHWTINEFITELKNFLNCEFTIDNISKYITMYSTSEEMSSAKKCISLNVIKEFNAEKTEDDESEYKESKGKEYESTSCSRWKYWVSDVPRRIEKRMDEAGEGIHHFRKAVSTQYSTIEDIAKNVCTEVNKEDQKYDTSIVFYKDDDGEYFLKKGKCPNNKTVFALEKVGEFEKIKPTSGTEYTTLKIVPAWIDETNVSSLIFCECGELEYEDEIFEDYEGDTSGADLYVKNYEESESEEVFDKIYVGFWNDSILETFRIPHDFIYDLGSYHTETLNYRGTIHPIVSNYEPYYPNVGVYFYRTFDEDVSKYSLALSSAKFLNVQIDGYTKYTMKFIADDIPNVDSIFIIEGQQYLCKKITATFKETGMSQLLKGEFYRITNS